MGGLHRLCTNSTPVLHKGHTHSDLGFRGRILKPINHGYLRRAEHIFKGPLRLLESQELLEVHEESEADSRMKTKVQI